MNYALYYPCGTNTTHTDGTPVVTVYSYATAALRDRHCEEFHSPTRPNATLIAVKASHKLVRRCSWEDIHHYRLVRASSPTRGTSEFFDSAVSDSWTVSDTTFTCISE
jgi:hypothetical protein